MKNLLLSVFCFLFFMSVVAQNRVVAEIKNFKNDKGACKVCLFNGEESFNGKSGTPFRCMSVPINNKSAQAVFTDIPAGNYAISVFHDANNNNKMDLNFLGIPKEGYGASKNKLPFASAPSFSDNQFIISRTAAVNLIIQLRNL